MGLGWGVRDAFCAAQEANQIALFTFNTFLLAMKRYILALVVTALVPAAILEPAFAEGMRQSSSGGSLDVVVDPQWGEDRQVQLGISFLHPGTDTVHEHIDYDLKITDSDGNLVYSAASQLNQPTLHTEPGSVTIPYRFMENGGYILTVEMTGILFIPIAPETAEFSVNVVPEFSAGVISATAATMAGAIAAARLKKI